MQLPQSRTDRALWVLMLLAAVIAAYACFQLFVGSGDSAQAADTSDGSTKPYEEGEFDKYEAGEQRGPGDGLSPVEIDARFGGVFDVTTSPVGTHTFGISMSTDGSPVRYQYAWRDDAGPGESAGTTGTSAQRRLRTARPAAVIWIQLGVDGGRASCTVTVDGKSAMTRTITAPYSVAFCVG